MVKELAKRMLPQPLHGPVKQVYRRLKNVMVSMAPAEQDSPRPQVVEPRLPAREAHEAHEEFSKRYFADIPVDLSRFGHFSGRKFPNAGPLAWLDRPDARWEIDRRLRENLITPEEARICHDFHDQGFVVLKGLLSPAQLDQTWARYEQAIREGRLTQATEKKGPDDPHPSNTINAHTAVPEIQQLISCDEVLRKVRLLLGVEPLPFQTLVFPKGREQLAHSDSVHMTTYPLGYMCATWTAFEDIHPDSGPLMYYPGSHRLPYVFARDVGISPEEFQQRTYLSVIEKYEPFIARVLESSGLQQQVFLPKKGDVLVWHANLIHGGSTRHDVKHSRRSLVCHYFGKGAFAYHDISGQPADRLTSSYDLM
jgi:hypothetical protein